MLWLGMFNYWMLSILMCFTGLSPSLRLNPVDFTTLPVAVTPKNLLTQLVLRIPTLRKNIQSTSRWSRSSSSRVDQLLDLVIFGYQNELGFISDHPMFAQPSNVKTAAQSELNWNSNGGGGAVTLSLLSATDAEAQWTDR
ncbi:hypothetical protein L2E82_25440 [Cichorium intybus]|uniref:Uncharacterized protein n=1 Tax=Cichorium intybus TaxID=13427 RepID=A0ACB9E433_CICIN|nr:hypothetical protein L2E82_25440 [Cichorium intybus]